MLDTMMENIKAVAERIRRVRQQLSNTKHEKTMLLSKLKLIIQKEERLNKELHEESRTEENTLKALAESMSGSHHEFKLDAIKTAHIFEKVTQSEVFDRINGKECSTHNQCGHNASLDSLNTDCVIEIVHHETLSVSENNSKESYTLIINQVDDSSPSSVISEQSTEISHSLVSDHSNMDSVTLANSVEIESTNRTISSGTRCKRKSINKVQQNSESSLKAEDNADRNKLVCDICKKVFKHNRSYKLHFGSHNKTATYSCPECNMKFKWPNQLRKHKRDHLKTAEFTCNHCAKDMKTSQRYSNHMRIHSGEKPFECNECGKQFSLKYSLSTHQMLHSGKRDHLCNICGKSYVDKCELTKHMATHSLQYGCDVCGKRFAYLRRLETHQLVHTDQYPFVCNVCGRAVRTSKALTLHLQTHYKVRVHACNICDRRFQQAGNLKAHLRTHTGEAAFSCRECAMKFRNGYNLKIHLLTHTDVLQKTFPCTVCGKKYIGRGILNSHLLSHSSETPHKCDECDKQYKRAIDLRIHKRKIHKGV